MYIKLSYDQEFDDLYMYLRSKYPRELFDLDGIGKQLDMHQFAKEFYKVSGTAADVSIDSNANVVGRDVITYNFEMPKPFHKLNSYYLLWKALKKKHGLEFANFAIEEQVKGGIYIHDAWDVGRPYCFNFSCFDIATQGLPMGDRVKPVPPKQLHSFLRQVEQFATYAANSTLGATGLADLLVVTAWYVDRILERGGERYFKFDSEEDTWGYIREVANSVIYTLNWQFRGNQSPFTNISLFDRHFLEKLIPSYAMETEVGEVKAPQMETVQILQECFMEAMNTELRRAPLTFPIATVCLSKVSEKESKDPESPWYGAEPNTVKDEDFLLLASKQNMEFGFLNFYGGDTATLSSCCRLRSEIEEDEEYFNSFGAGSTKIGSLGVVSPNLPRIAEICTAHEDPKSSFLLALNLYTRLAAEVNAAKRSIIAKRVERGNLPLYTLGHMDLKKQYSTLGITGLNEAVEILGEDILEEGGQALVTDALRVVNATNDEMKQQLGYRHNCEQVPAETASIKLASKDKLLGFACGQNYPYYSNQFIPLTTKADMLDRIRLQGMFDKDFSGGAICHLNVGEQITNPEKIATLVRTSIKQGVVYFAINYQLNRCALGHMSVGQHTLCPVCGHAEITDTFTRVVGFLTNTKNWHQVRREHDWPNRQFYQGVENE